MLFLFIKLLPAKVKSVLYNSKEEKHMQYKIEGTPLPVVICNLAAGETMITETGSLSWMSPNMKM